MARSSSGNNPDQTSFSAMQQILKPNKKPVVKTDFSSRVLFAKNDPTAKGTVYIKESQVEHYKEKYPNGKIIPTQGPTEADTS